MSAERRAKAEAQVARMTETAMKGMAEHISRPPADEARQKGPAVPPSAPGAPPPRPPLPESELPRALRSDGAVASALDQYGREVGGDAEAERLHRRLQDDLRGVRARVCSPYGPDQQALDPLQRLRAVLLSYDSGVDPVLAYVLGDLCGLQDAADSLRDKAMAACQQGVECYAAALDHILPADIVKAARLAVAERQYRRGATTWLRATCTSICTGCASGVRVPAGGRPRGCPASTRPSAAACGA
jgi:hypothetical protein